MIVNDLIEAFEAVAKIGEDAERVILLEATYHEEARNYVVRVDYEKRKDDGEES